MTEINPILVQRMRRAGFLLIFGLLIEAGSFFWVHPLAFIAFAMPGAAFVGFGILLFLYASISR